MLLTKSRFANWWNVRAPSPNNYGPVRLHVYLVNCLSVQCDNWPKATCFSACLVVWLDLGITNLTRSYLGNFSDFRRVTHRLRKLRLFSLALSSFSPGGEGFQLFASLSICLSHGRLDLIVTGLSLQFFQISGRKPALSFLFERMDISILVCTEITIFFRFKYSNKIKTQPITSWRKIQPIWLTSQWL